MKCALLTSKDLPNLIEEELPLIDLFSQQGVSCDIVVWDAFHSWKNYDYAVIRTTWDYFLKHQKFLDVLQNIERSGCRLLNARKVVQWNLNKTYLLELQEQGVPVLPVELFEPSQDNLHKYFSMWNTDRVVVKPTISAGAYHTYLLHKNDQVNFPNIPLMIQPFCPQIVTEGEWSFMFFGTKFSHAVLKTPKTDDFRVQEEHGGVTTLATPSSEDLRQAVSVMARVPELLYARVDMIRYQGKLHLIELELIEPQLFFAADSGSSSLFVEAFCHLVW